MKKKTLFVILMLVAMLLSFSTVYADDYPMLI